MSQPYIGGELELFAAAKNWKSYCADNLRRFVHGRVLEVGAGIGSNIPFLHNRYVSSWISLEPDRSLVRRIEQRIANNELPQVCRPIPGTIEVVPETESFDTILYLDVLEHIADDAQELRNAARHLAPGGHLIVLAPAHQFLFTPFDAAIGHFRRYDRSGLLRLTPPGCTLVTCRLLDCAGFVASLANRLVLSSAMPSRVQIAIWDRVLVRLSRRLDRAFGYRFGKTVVAVWRGSG